MTLSVAVTGQRELRALSALLAKVDRRDLERELRDANRDAFSGLEPDVKENALRYMPSGYGPTLAKDVKVEVVTSFAWMSVLAIISARGRRKLRDVRARNRGSLRHPVFGNRDVWRDTRVRPGFVDAAVDKIPDQAVRESLRAIRRIKRRIERG